MTVTRRRFLASSAAAVTAASLMPTILEAGETGKAARSLRILILGGTGFLGPACTETALARGHAVTHFNSGRTEERRREVGRPSVVPTGVEQLFGNRDPNKTAADRRSEGKANARKNPNSPKGLSQLVGKLSIALRSACLIHGTTTRGSGEKPKYLHHGRAAAADSSENLGVNRPRPLIAFFSFQRGKLLSEKHAEAAPEVRAPKLKLRVWNRGRGDDLKFFGAQFRIQVWDPVR